MWVGRGLGVGAVGGEPGHSKADEQDETDGQRNQTDDVGLVVVHALNDLFETCSKGVEFGNQRCNEAIEVAGGGEPDEGAVAGRDLVIGNAKVALMAGQLFIVIGGGADGIGIEGGAGVSNGGVDFGVDEELGETGGIAGVEEDEIGAHLAGDLAELFFGEQRVADLDAGGAAVGGDVDNIEA